MSEEDDLPEGWASCEIGDVAEVIGGGTPKSTVAANFSNDGIPWITPADLSDFGGICIDRGRRGLTEQGLKSCSARMVPSGTVLMSSRAPIGYVAIAARPLCTNQGFKSFIFHPDILPELAYYWLRFKRDAIEEMGSGTTFLEVSGSRCKEIPLTMPPLAEQKRIVAKVETLLARVNAARQRLAKVPVFLKRFRQSVLAAACSGQLTENWRAKSRTPMENGVLPSSWTEERLADVSLRVTDGTHLPPALAPDGVPFILIGNIVNKRIEWDLVRKWVTRETYERLTARCKPEMGDVLYTAVGATFGQALAVETNRPFIFQRHIAHIKPNYAKVATGFLVGALNSPAIFAHAQDVAKGAAQPTVTLTDLKEFVIPIPPLAEQREIVRRVEALLARADRIEKRLATATRRVETLTQAILAQAFRGELVPTEAELARQEGRDYEPAAVLLERIRTARTTKAPAGKNPPRTRRKN